MRGAFMTAVLALALSGAVRAETAALLVGAATADITPPLEAGLLMSSSKQLWAPFQDIRMPLKARCVVIQYDTVRIALVSLDLIGLAGESVRGMRSFRDRVAAAASNVIAPDNLVLACTHTHTAPESIALTDLQETAPFRSWIDVMATKVGSAIREAALHLEPCRLMIGSAPAPDMAVNRRIRTTKGIASARRQLPPETIIGPEGPIDETVRVASLVADHGRPVAILVNFTAHPVLEMCIPRVSPDYPGEMCAALETAHPGAHVLFFQGAAGNINPPTMDRNADNAAAYGKRLATCAENALKKSNRIHCDRISLRWKTAALPARQSEMTGIDAKSVEARIGAFHIGDAVFIFLPGEPFVEIADAIRAASKSKFTAVIGYADAYIGYIPTDRAFQNGGYETQNGKWSRLGPGAADIVQRTAIELLSEP